MRDIQVPGPDPTEGLLAVEGSGVCGADWAAYNGALSWLRGRSVILGHEVVGSIARLGAVAARRWGVREGDRVVVEEPIPCGTCADCLAGSYHWCHVGLRFGATAVDEAPLLGGYADYMHLPAQALVHRISHGIPVEEAVLFIPIANGLHWVHSVGAARPGSTVIIHGVGQHALGCVIAAREVGAGRVIVIGTATDGGRLKIAERLGADDTLTIDDDLVARVKDLTGRRMGDVVINAAPSARALETSIDLVARRGTVVNAGESEDRASISLQQLIRKEVVLKGVAGRPHDAVRAAIRVIESGRHPLDLLSTDRFTLDQTELAIQTVGRVDVASDPLHVTVTAGGAE